MAMSLYFDFDIAMISKTLQFAKVFLYSGTKFLFCSATIEQAVGLCLIYLGYETCIEIEVVSL